MSEVSAAYAVAQRKLMNAIQRHTEKQVSDATKPLYLDLAGMKSLHEKTLLASNNNQEKYDSTKANYDTLRNNFNQQLENAMAEHNKKYSELKLAHTHIADELIKKNQHYEGMKKAHDNLAANFNQKVKQATEELQNNYDALRAKHNQMASDFSRKRKSYDKLFDDFDRVSREFAVKKKKYDGLKAEFDAVSSDNSRKKKSCADLELAHNALESDFNKRVKEATKELEQKCNQLQMACAHYAREINKNNLKFDALKSAHVKLAKMYAESRHSHR